VIPVQAVFEDAEGPHAFVLTNGRPERRPLEVSAANAFQAAVHRGVMEDETVLLVNPFADTPAPRKP
jgi:hypothetical protein